MSLEVYFLTETLQRMEQQGAIIRPQTAMIATFISSDQYLMALRASKELNRALEAFVSMSARLQDYVVMSDGMGDVGASVGEVALRARSLVVSEQLDALCIALQKPEHLGRTSEWFGGQLTSIAAIRTYVIGELQLIHGRWLQYRDGQPQPGMLEAERTTAYRMMVRIAQRRLCELRDEPDLACLLLNGMEAHDLPVVQLACKQIHTVLGLEIDIETGRPLHPKRQRIGTPSGTPVQR